MTKTHTFVLVIVALILSFSLGCTSATRSTDTHMNPSLRIHDISMEIDGQRYACKVMINEAATVGGDALLFLHGAGECGTEGVRQLHVGLPRYAMESPEDWPFVIIAPQKPSVNSEWEHHADAVIALLDKALAMGLYDPNRLAITGLSQGGHGTITIAGLFPERFKAVGPVCPYIRTVFDKDRQRIPRVQATPDMPETVEAANKLATLPVWLHHGDADVVVPVWESRALQSALRTLDADVRYSEYPDVNHNSWDNAYTDPQFSAWFQDHIHKD